MFELEKVVLICDDIRYSNKYNDHRPGGRGSTSCTTRKIFHPQLNPS